MPVGAGTDAGPFAILLNFQLLAVFSFKPLDRRFPASVPVQQQHFGRERL
jgi:hypothetical protein